MPQVQGADQDSGRLGRGEGPRPRHRPKGHEGTTIFKPIGRLEVAISGNVWLIGVGCAVMAMLAAWLLKKPLMGEPRLAVPQGKTLLLRAIAILILTPGLSVAGYFLLRDREKLDLFGESVWLRTAICTAAYLILWGGYAYVRYRYNMPTEVWQLFVILPSMLGLARWPRSGPMSWSSAAHLCTTVFTC